ncbi:MAG: prepilin-type N-terminal cleavage/methylation domain-containing protein [archaeon]
MKKARLHTKGLFILTRRFNLGGFSLVELLVSISIFLVFVIAVTNTMGKVTLETRSSANRERAVVLAEEALEATRNIRDSANGFANLPDGTYGLVSSGNIWNFSGSSDNTDIFNRAINISTISSNQKKVVSTVSWADQTSPTNTISLKTYLTNWRAPLNIGITIDKTVVGGTKVPSDFLPYNLTTNVLDNTVDPPILQSVDIPIVFSPSTMTGLSPGVYTFLTTSDPDYNLSLSSACLGNSITLTNGAMACTITYTANSIPCTGTPWGTMADGTSNTAYQTSSVNYPSLCVSETRTCTAGTLSGTYTNTSCTVNSILPTVSTTTPITNITRTTATGGGNVNSDGGASVTARGIVWSTSINPTIALTTKTNNGTGTGVFSSNITSLTCNTLYHVRAYATNSVGTSYGSDVTFTTSACSNIIFVAQNAANGTTVTIPAHNVGDLLVVFAYRSSSNSLPTVPSGWTTINTSGSSSNSSSLAYRIATGSDSGSGWSNATQVIVQVYRGVSASPIGVNGFQHANSTTVTYPALSLSVTDGTSWVIGFAGDANNSTPIEIAPTGMTARADIVGASAEASGHDTNGGVSSWTAKNVIISAGNVKWSARTLEIKSN